MTVRLISNERRWGRERYYVLIPHLLRNNYIYIVVNSQEIFFYYYYFSWPPVDIDAALNSKDNEGFHDWFKRQT